MRISPAILTGMLLALTAGSATQAHQEPAANAGKPAGADPQQRPRRRLRRPMPTIKSAPKMSSASTFGKSLILRGLRRCGLTDEFLCRW